MINSLPVQRTVIGITTRTADGITFATVTDNGPGIGGAS